MGAQRKIQESTARFVEKIHYMSFSTNLAIAHLSKLSVGCEIESFLSSLDKYFSHPPKKGVKFLKLATLMQTKGLVTS